MYCQKCGTKLIEGAKFCASCGATSDGLANEPKLPVSGLRRFANLMLDRFFAYLLMGILGVTISLMSGAEELPAGVAVLIFFGSAFFYYVVCESLWQRTLGKAITGTKVVDRNGNKPKFWTICGRTLARCIPFEKFSFLIGSNPIGWHDRISKTLVVASSFTPEDVQKIDYAEAKKSKSGMIVVIIVGALVFFAVIGILSTIVLTSLGTARDRAQSARSRDYSASEMQVPQ